LVAHGTLRRGRPFVWLEDERGGIGRIEGEELIEAIERLARRPVLVVLASCQSAGTGQDNGALAALGPRLASAGIAATVAMQGNVSMATVERFMPVFFTELRRDGQIDRALAAARAAVLDRPDWWMPVLFLRVRSGRLWAEPEPSKPAANIPPPPPPERPPEALGFVGREAELAEFEASLATNNAVIITGMPGIGKTSLAALLARKIAATDAIFWHSFNAGEGIDTLIWALAGFLAHNDQAGLWDMLQSARQSGGQPPPTKVLFDYLLEMVRGKGYVLCFDDFSFVDQDVQLEQFVERLRPELRAGGIRLILTSRRIPEFIQEYAISELAGLREADVRRLLDARDTRLADTLIADLHAQTGGNAQLVSLAAAALQRASDPARVIAHLAETDNIERYLLNEVDARLGDDERKVMRVIAALLDYGGTRDAIETLLDGDSARRALRALSDRYLLIPHDGPAGREYRQHALVQPFYYGELSRRERLALHQRAGAYYEREERDMLRAAIHYDRAGNLARAADLATADVWALINAGQARALCRFLERFVVRQAEPPEADHLDPERWAAVQVALGTAYPFAGERGLARQRNEAAWSYLEQLPDAPAVRVLKAQLCAEMGRLLQNDDPRLALDWLQRGLAAIAENSPEHAAQLLILISSVQIALADYPAARDAAQQGLALLAVETSPLRVSALISLGRIAYHEGALGQAMEQMQRALRLNEQLHDSFRTIGILVNLGVFKDVAGDWEGALEDYRRGVDLAGQLGSNVQQARLEQNIGMLSMNMGDDEAAMAHLTSGLALARAGNMREFELGCQSGLIDLYLRRGEVDAAMPLLIEAERLAHETDNSLRMTEIDRWWAEVYLRRGDMLVAREYAERAIGLGREMGDPYDEGLSLRIQGQILHAHGQTVDASNVFEQSQKLLADDPYESARTQALFGLALRSGQERERGMALLEQARATFARLGAKRDLAEVDRWLAA
jgi:tetratricopeptide (TPR) repeat protein